MITQLDSTPKSRLAWITNTVTEWLGYIGKEALVFSCLIALWAITASTIYYLISGLLNYLR